VLDLGANVGEFSQKMHSLFGCTCLAIEPMPPLYEKIETSPRIKKFNLAISDQEGTIRLYTSGNPEANSIFENIAAQYDVTETAECRATTLECFLEHESIESIDLLKLDIEGAEQRLFESTTDRTLRSIKQITIEFHDFIPNSISSSEVRAIRRRLKRLGFLCIPASYVIPSAKTSDHLFINMKRCQPPLGDRIGFQIVRCLLGLESMKSWVAGKFMSAGVEVKAAAPAYVGHSAKR
jgi:FkbM family methyltransferase